MMNATYAKQPFTLKTLSEAFSHLSTMLNVKFDQHKTYPSMWNKFDDYNPQLSTSKVTIYQPQLDGELALLKYQVAIFGIFVERLLNKNWKLTAENIDQEESTMVLIMSFFNEWSLEVYDSNKKQNIQNKIGEKHFISKKNTS